MPLYRPQRAQPRARPTPASSPHAVVQRGDCPPGAAAAVALTLLASCLLLLLGAPPPPPPLPPAALTPAAPHPAPGGAALAYLAALVVPSSPSPTRSPAPTPTPSAPYDPPPQAPHIALCITGSLRTFLLPPVHQSIHDHLVAPHRTPGSNASIDVYLFLTTAHSLASSPFHGVTDAECSAAPLAAALQLLRPAHVELFNGQSSCQAGVTFFGEPCCGEGQLRSVAYMQMGWVRKCFAHARSVHNYTHYVRTRPDLYIGAPVPAWVYAPRNYHRLWTMDKDARGSDMFFVVSEAVMQAWWLPFPWGNCSLLPDAYAEYMIFEACATRRSYDRTRCREAECMASLPPPALDVEPPQLPGDEAQGAATPLHQLPGMRNIIVRSADRVSCWKMGFYCRPDDELALLAALRNFTCATLVEGLRAEPGAEPAVKGGGVVLRLAQQAGAAAQQRQQPLEVLDTTGGWARVL